MDQVYVVPEQVVFRGFGATPSATHTRNLLLKNGTDQQVRAIVSYPFCPAFRLHGPTDQGTALQSSPPHWLLNVPPQSAVKVVVELKPPEPSLDEGEPADDHLQDTLLVVLGERLILVPVYAVRQELGTSLTGAALQALLQKLVFWPAVQDLHRAGAAFLQRINALYYMQLQHPVLASSSSNGVSAPSTSSSTQQSSAANPGSIGHNSITTAASRSNASTCQRHDSTPLPPQQQGTSVASTGLPAMRRLPSQVIPPDSFSAPVPDAAEGQDDAASFTRPVIIHQPVTISGRTANAQPTSAHPVRTCSAGRTSPTLTGGAASTSAAAAGLQVATPSRPGSSGSAVFMIDGHAYNARGEQVALPEEGHEVAVVDCSNGSDARGQRRRSSSQDASFLSAAGAATLDLSLQQPGHLPALHLGSSGGSGSLGGAGCGGQGGSPLPPRPRTPLSPLTHDAYAASTRLEPHSNSQGLGPLPRRVLSRSTSSSSPPPPLQSLSDSARATDSGDALRNAALAAAMQHLGILDMPHRTITPPAAAAAAGSDANRSLPEGAPTAGAVAKHSLRIGVGGLSSLGGADTGLDAPLQWEKPGLVGGRVGSGANACASVATRSSARVAIRRRSDGAGSDDDDIEADLAKRMEAALLSEDVGFVGAITSSPATKPNGHAAPLSSCPKQDFKAAAKAGTGVVNSRQLSATSAGAVKTNAADGGGSSNMPMGVGGRRPRSRSQGGGEEEDEFEAQLQRKIEAQLGIGSSAGAGSNSNAVQALDPIPGVTSFAKAHPKAAGPAAGKRVQLTQPTALSAANSSSHPAAGGAQTLGRAASGARASPSVNQSATARKPANLSRGQPLPTSEARRKMQSNWDAL